MMAAAKSRPAAAAVAVEMAKEKPPSPAAAAAKEEVWEVRPGGMLVQKRSPEELDGATAAAVPTIRVKVKYAGVYHEVYVSSQASFGELKKLLASRTGVHPEDQKLVFKDRERDSKAFLDNAGVRDKSKMVLVEDPTLQAKRLLEARRASKIERAVKAVARISHDVDKLASKVSALEMIVKKGCRVVEADVVALTESLMNELVKLDAIAGDDGGVRAQRQTQEKRVQKLVETLDMIKIKNAAAAAAAAPLPPRPPPQSQRRNFTQQPPAPAPATVKWESFDLLSSTPSTSSAASSATASSTASVASPRFEWELF